MTMGKLNEIFDMMFRMGMNEKKYPLTESEKYEISIVENQHVAGFRYDNVLKEMMRYVEKYIRTTPYHKQKGFMGIKGGFWTFEIPKSITEKITFIENLRVIVHVEDFRAEQDDFSVFGRGITYHSDANKIVDGVLKSETIEVYGLSINKRLCGKSISGNLFHELNHAYEEYKRLEKNDVVNGIDRTVVGYRKKREDFLAKIDKSGLDTETTMFRFLVYRLFDKSELSAASTSTYAYLQSIDGKRENVTRDIQQTQAYQEYNIMKSYLDTLEKHWGEEWWNVKKKLYSNKENLKTQGFKNWFIGYCRILLKRYFHYMTSAAALYYDSHEEKKAPPKVVYSGHMDPPITPKDKKFKWFKK